MPSAELRYWWRYLALREIQGEMGCMICGVELPPDSWAPWVMAGFCSKRCQHIGTKRSMMAAADDRDAFGR